MQPEMGLSEPEMVKNLQILSQQPNSDVKIFFGNFVFVLPFVKWLTVFAHSDFRKKLKNILCEWLV